MHNRLDIENCLAKQRKASCPKVNQDFAQTHARKTHKNHLFSEQSNNQPGEGFLRFLTPSTALPQGAAYDFSHAVICLRVLSILPAALPAVRMTLPLRHVRRP